MSVAKYINGANGRYTAVPKNDDGTAIVYDAGGTATPRMTSLTLTVVDAASGDVINSRTDQDVFNANDVSLDSVGALKWELQPNDTTPLASAADTPLVEHIATFVGTYIDTDEETKTVIHEHRVRIPNGSPLCTVDDMAEQLSIDDDDRHLCQMIIEAVTARFETETARKFRRATFTQYLSPRAGTSSIRVERYPVESVTSLSEDGSGVFGVADVIDATAYDAVARAHKGIVSLRHRWFGGGVGTVKFVGVGGYRDPGAVPWDLRMAAIRQSLFLYQRRRQMGETGVSMDGRSISVTVTDLLDDVKKALANHTPKTIP